MKVMPPHELMGYVGYKDGEVIIKKPLPDELVQMYEEYKKEVREASELKNKSIQEFLKEHRKK